MAGKDNVRQLTSARQECNGRGGRGSYDHDPQYQALRLHGLAGLLRATGWQVQELTNLNEVMFFLSSELDEIAVALEGGD